MQLTHTRTHRHTHNVPRTSMAFAGGGTRRCRELLIALWIYVDMHMIYDIHIHIYIYIYISYRSANLNGRSVGEVLADVVSYLTQRRDKQQTESEPERKRPKRNGEACSAPLGPPGPEHTGVHASRAQPGGAQGEAAAVTDAAVADSDWRAGLLSSRELFCVELAVDARGRATHATMAALGQGALEFFRTSPWGDMHGHVFYNLIHPEDRAKLDDLLRQHACGRGQGAVTRMRLVHFRTCQLETNLGDTARAHDASLAAASGVSALGIPWRSGCAPDVGLPSWGNTLPDDPLPEDPMLDDGTGAVPRRTPGGRGDAEVTRGKTFFMAAHIALDFQLVAAHDGEGGLAGGKMVVMAPLHTATPPLRSCSEHIVLDERTMVQWFSAINGIYQSDPNVTRPQDWLQPQVCVEGPRTSDVHDVRERPAMVGWRFDQWMFSRVSGIMTNAAWLLRVGGRFFMRFIQRHLELDFDANGIPYFCCHVRISGKRFALPWFRCIDMDLSGNRAYPMTRFFGGKPENQVFFLPVFLDPLTGAGFCVFWCQPREWLPSEKKSASNFSVVPCEEVCRLACGTPHAVNYGFKSETHGFSAVKVKCAVAEAVQYLRIFKTGEFDGALASRGDARRTHWHLI